MPNEQITFSPDQQPVHIIGLGGAGMSGVARLLLAQGVRVSGSDAKESRRLAALKALGADVAIGHDAANVAGAGLVVISTAIAEDNPELAAARAAGIPVIHRSEALAAVSRNLRVIAVAGTHGKTTTTSMLTVALQSCAADPSYAIGSELNESGSNAHLGTGPDFVVEADESDGSFLRAHPFAGIVTNVEPDHLNYWGTFEALEQAFVDFVHLSADAGGFTVICHDDPGAASLVDGLGDLRDTVRTYGQGAAADYRITVLKRAGRGWRFQVTGPSPVPGAKPVDVEVRLQVPGEHNCLNATAALVTAAGLGYPISEIGTGLEGFTGTRRRFDFRGEANGVRVYDDYAHHPTEIEATLRAARDVVGDGRLVVAFQAHHYYRTALFVEEFGQALGLADEVVVLEVFAPGEEPIPGASGQSMAANVPLPAEQVVFEPSWSKVAGHLASRARPGDIVMTLGAGDIGMLAPQVLEELDNAAGGAR